MFTAKDVQTLRQRTGAGMMECKRALQENEGDMDKSAEYLRAKGIAKAGQRAGKQTSEGLISSYIHHNGKVGVMVEINCETDFVARTDDFKTLAREIALHIASAAPLAVDKDGIPEEKVAVERRIAEEQARASGKPEAIAKRIALVEIIPGKGSGQLKKHVLRFLNQAHIRTLYHRVEKDDRNFGRIFIHFRH